ncbi:siroheme synthase [Sphingomonas sp. BIUV-7]|uniref:precorrin-2 dehydrogenase n=1 Tax=Sphingomonas natans TaxID=3063330 RepID=A0ABT8YC58_9SPHN|nr:siroheme synthase [Sphingomonas sp. BIUV-7]MDO6415915.1 siroheme synthase [Sphingomonas sp. BIUV-7]
MDSFPIFVRLRAQPVILIGEGDTADAKRRLLERAGAMIVGEADQAARLAFVALDDPDDTAVRLKARGLLVNAADRPDLCDFTLPAIVDRDPVLIAIGTSGASAGLAAALRQRLEALLPPSLGALARLLHQSRESLRARYPDASARRRFIGGLLAAGAPLDPMIEHPDPAIPGEGAPDPARLERITLRSSDPDELTLRAARLLALADRIYHPSDAPPAILDRARADAVRIVGPAPALALPGLSVEIL